MNVISRLLNRIHFRRTISGDQSRNVVDGMVRAHSLYRQLSVIAHPDKNPENRETAEKIMQQIASNKYNYEALISLKAEIKEKLNK